MSLRYSDVADYVRLDVMHFMFTKMDKRVLILCHDKMMKKEIFNDLYIGFCDMRLSPYIKHHICTDQPNKGEICLDNGSILSIASPNEGGEWLCGVSAHLVYIFEMEKFNKEAVDDIMACLYPVVSARDGKIVGLENAT